MPQAWTKRVAALHAETPGPFDLYSPPAGVAVILRDILVANYEPEPTDVRVIIQSGSFQYDLLSLAALPSLETRHVDLRQELLLGETLRFYTSNPPSSVVVTAYVFSLS